MIKNNTVSITLILPGYSFHNRQWAYEVKEKLERKGLSAKVYEWKHWTGGRMDINGEVEALVELIGGQKVNVIAKSVGTKVFMKLYSKVETKINKVILCGIPFDPASYLKGLKKLGGGRLIIFQNSHDPFMPYSVVNAFVKFVSKDIKVIKKEARTHNYPYYEDFISFLS